MSNSPADAFTDLTGGKPSRLGKWEAFCRCSRFFDFTLAGRLSACKPAGNSETSGPRGTRPASVLNTLKRPVSYRPTMVPRRGRGRSGDPKPYLNGSPAFHERGVPSLLSIVGCAMEMPVPAPVPPADEFFMGEMTQVACGWESGAPCNSPKVQFRGSGGRTRLVFPL